LKKEKLHHCDYCRRPMWLLGADPEKKLKFVEKAGPTTHTKVKLWCDGSCDGLNIMICILESEILNFFKKSKERKLLVLKLRRLKIEVTDYCRARDKNKVPLSPERKEIRRRIHQCLSSKSR